MKDYLSFKKIKNKLTSLFSPEAEEELEDLLGPVPVVSDTTSIKQSKAIELKPITSISQLVGSYYVAAAIEEIRSAQRVDIVEKAGQQIKLTVSDKRAQDLFKRLGEITNYSISYMTIAKIAMEDIEVMNFDKDPSVVAEAKQDTQHLATDHGNNFQNLAKITLKDHTYNVFEEAIIQAEARGRAGQVAQSCLAALFHDFGKSTEIRSLLVGETMGRGYKPHAEVSAQYVESVLPDRLADLEMEVSSELISTITASVQYHHPAQKRKASPSVLFIMEADSKARKKELKSLA